MIVFVFFTFLFVFLIFATIMYIIYRFGGDVRMLYEAAKITKEQAKPIKVVSPVPNNRRKDIINNMYLSMAEPQSPIKETFSDKHLSKIEGDSILVDENGEIKDWQSLQNCNVSSAEDVTTLDNHNNISDTSIERKQINSFIPISDSFSFPLIVENVTSQEENDIKKRENYAFDIEKDSSSEEVNWDKLLNSVQQRLNTRKDNS